jgi:outer membrane protein assembly factor BamD
MNSASLAALAFLCGCSTSEENFANMSVEDLYAQAKRNLDGGHLTSAAKGFAEVERQHPYSNWAVKAQLMSAYSYYTAKKYEEAIEGFKTFTQLHPGYEHADYAYYMIGLCAYEQIPTVQRDQDITRESLNAFQEVVRRFPSSGYAKDARLKIDLIVDHLAGTEMDVGRFYLREKSYLAAINRFKVVVAQYQTTSHITEALYRLVECYLGLGILDQAKASAAVLGHNYPGSSWYADAYGLLCTHVPGMVKPDAQGATGPRKAEETSTSQPLPPCS